MRKHTRKRKGINVGGEYIVPPETDPKFPLTAHSRGGYCIVRGGKMRYYGRWYQRRNGQIELLPDGWRQAWDEYLRDTLPGEQPRGDDYVSIADVCNAFYNAKKAALEANELSPAYFADCKSTTDLIVAHFGNGADVEKLTADDFASFRAALAKRFGPVRLTNAISRVRSVFKHAFDSDLIDRMPKFGPGFKRPSKGVMRKHEAKRTDRTFEAEEIRTMLDHADPIMKSWILLAVNCGYGAGDLSALERRHVNLEHGTIDFPRPKTGIKRRCPLWNETVEALRTALPLRPVPKDHDDIARCFLTPRGLPLVRSDANVRDNKVTMTKCDEVAVRFGKLVRDLGLHKPGRGFYSFRHTFRTVADDAKDQVAADIVMGHARTDMADNYRHRIDDERLRAVVDHVRSWLFPAKGDAPQLRLFAG